MSAQLAPLAPYPHSFSASLTLADGVSAHISAPSLQSLSLVVAKLQPTEAANEAPGKPAATVPAGSTGTQTAASSARAAAAQAAGDAGNVSASTATPATAQPAAAGSVAAGEAGNAAAASTQQAATAAAAASSSAAAQSPEVSFDVLKKAFLALSTKADGRAKCEGVLKPFGLAKLSEAKSEQYAAVLASINKASE